MKKVAASVIAVDTRCVRTMAIYTKTGDDGTTALYGGKRVLKSDPRVAAYGSTDELTSFLGLLISRLKEKPSQKLLTLIQKDLYGIMGVLAGSQNHLNLESRIKQFEKHIDTMESKLPKLYRFILPQGNEVTALFHIARAVCRRAERDVVEFSSQPITENRQLRTIIKYLNRLSDLFFVLARWYNKKQKEVVT